MKAETKVERQRKSKETRGEERKQEEAVGGNRTSEGNK